MSVQVGKSLKVLVGTLEPDRREGFVSKYQDPEHVHCLTRQRSSLRTGAMRSRLRHRVMILVTVFCTRFSLSR